MRVSSGAAVVALVVASHTARADDHPLAKLGDACAVHADCAAELHCLKNVCVTDETLVSSRAAARDEQNEDDDHTHFFIGGVVGAALPAIWTSAGEGATLGVHIGVIVQHLFQFELEAAPGVITGVYSTADATFDVVATAAAFIPVHGMVSWITRVGGGVGVVLGSTGPSNIVATAGEVRLDFVGVAIRPSRHVLIELNVPSVRVMIMQPNLFPTNVLVSFVTSVAMSYVF